MNFSRTKIRELLKYEKAVDSKLVDVKAIELNSIINDINEFYTTSSCSGRLTIISKKSVHAKYETIFHFKSHNPEKVRKGITKKYKFNDELWIILESPNFHVICKDISFSKRLQTSALKAKFGMSKIQSVHPNIVVEVLGTSRIHIPIGKDNIYLVNNEYLEYVADLAIQMLENEQEKLVLWKKRLTEEFIRK